MPTTWSPELKEEVKAAYLEKNPTAENTVEVIEQVKNTFNEKDPELDLSINGIRMVLTKLGVYIKKIPTSSAAKATEGGDKPKRVNKQDSIDALVKVLEDKNVEIDMDIIGKMTGKAAIYFKEAIDTILSEG